MSHDFAPNDPIWQTLADIDAETSNNFRTLVEAANLDPATDLRDVSLVGLCLAKQDLSGFDFSGTDLRGTSLRRASSAAGLKISKSTILDPADRKWLRRQLGLGVTKPLIFISYAHADEQMRASIPNLTQFEQLEEELAALRAKPEAADQARIGELDAEIGRLKELTARGEEFQWLSFVMDFLRPAARSGEFAMWVDRQMPGGTKWDKEIERALRACDIFILLVSRHSMASDHVVKKEIAFIRRRQAKGEDVHFYPLVLTPTPKIALDKVRDKNLRPRNGKPLSSYSLAERYGHMSEIADEIAEVAAEIASRKRSAPALPPLPPSQSPTPTASRAPRALAGSLVSEVSVALHGAGSKASAGEFVLEFLRRIRRLR